MKKIDWQTYNKSLKARGEIDFWFDPEIFEQWYFSSEESRAPLGSPRRYSDLAIRMLHIVRFRFGLTLRETVGFAESLAQLLEVEIDMPCYTTLSRRLRKLQETFTVDNLEEGPLTVAVDASGLKVFGEGEWKVRMYGVSKRRLWRKLHVAVNPNSNQILSVVFADSSLGDGQVFADLLTEIQGPVEKVVGDGAYDSKECYGWVEERGIKGIFPPDKNAKIKKHGNSKGPPLQRDEHMRRIRETSRSGWKKESGYHQRSLAETTFSRFKTLLGDTLSSRNYENQAHEVFLKCWILNQALTPKALNIVN